MFEKYWKTPNFNPADPIKAQESQLERRRQAARQIVAQSMQQNPSEIVGGSRGNGKWHARPSILVPGNTLGTAIAQGAAGYMAGRENQAIDKAEMDAARQREQQHRDWLARQPGGAANQMPQTGGGEQPSVGIRNQLDMLMGDESKAAHEAAANESAMLNAFNNQPQQGATSYTNPQGAADDDGVIRMGVTRHESEPAAYQHPPMVATAPTDLPPQGGSEPQPPQSLNNQLRWLLEGSQMEAPGANLLLNQTGRDLMMGKSRASDDTSQIKNYRFAQTLPEAERAAFLGSANADDPAAIAEWKAYQKMGPEEKRAYLNMKRANMQVNMGGSTAIVDATGMPVAQYAKSLPPEATPAVRGQQAAAVAEATQGVTQSTDAAKKQSNRDAFAAIAAPAYAILRSGNPTGSGVGSAVDAAAGVFGRSTPGAQQAAQLKTYAGQMQQFLEKAKGDLSDLEVRMMQERIGAISNDKLPVATRRKALEAAMGAMGIPVPSSNAQAVSDGTRGKLKDGTPVIRRNGQWVKQ